MEEDKLIDDYEMSIKCHHLPDHPFLNLQSIQLSSVSIYHQALTLCSLWSVFQLVKKAGISNMIKMYFF